MTIETDAAPLKATRREWIGAEVEAEDLEAESVLSQ